MAHYLSLQATYTTYQLGLYDNSTCLAFKELDKKLANKDLILSIDQMLKDHSLKLSHLDFIGINQGPGPFTSLRIIVTTVNALYFATQIPLVGINSLEALFQETTIAKNSLCVALLNAYNNDLYYALHKETAVIEQGCKNNRLLLAELKELYPNYYLQFIGNGATLNKELILELFGPHAITQKIQEASLDTIAAMSLEKFNNNQTSQQLMPLYLKSLSYQSGLTTQQVLG